MEITERLMEEAQAWVNEMNAVLDSIDKDWNAYQVYYDHAVQTLECLSILTDESYFIDTDEWNNERIYKWNK